jgi:hypothetical protein
MKINNKNYKLYLSYLNDFLTLSSFCEYYNLSEKKALQIIGKYKNI